MDSRPQQTVRAEVHHQPDRSYVVLIDEPDGKVAAGRTYRTRDVLSMARAGVARMLGVPEKDLGPDSVSLIFPQPPYGTDGQWVRIAAVENPADPFEAVVVGLLGKAYWSELQAAWFVTTAGAGTGIHPSEDLDFAPAVSDEEVAAFDAYVSRADPPP